MPLGPSPSHGEAQGGVSVGPGKALGQRLVWVPACPALGDPVQPPLCSEAVSSSAKQKEDGLCAGLWGANEAATRHAERQAGLALCRLVHGDGQ